MSRRRRAFESAYYSCGYGSPYDAMSSSWDDELTEEEIAEAKPTPLPKKLLDSLVGMEEAEANRQIISAGLVPRTLSENNVTFRLKRNRVNLQVDKKVVVLAFIG